MRASEKDLPVLSSVKTRDFFQIFVAFSEKLDFKNIPVRMKKVKTIIEVYPKYKKVDAAPSISSFVMK